MECSAPIGVEVLFTLEDRYEKIKYIVCSSLAKGLQNEGRNVVRDNELRRLFNGNQDLHMHADDALLAMLLH